MVIFLNWNSLGNGTQLTFTVGLQFENGDFIGLGYTLPVCKWRGQDTGAENVPNYGWQDLRQAKMSHNICLCCSASG